ncbi:hypothetical protein ACELLULO517_18820 [Acidisoma cellulosilytica]|uniref:Uncharacterized protein n=1 Tax=Acidisoma cellulosilyticum TaxID=2802395 RepID=A0A963Z5Q7_9PROT|nr:hypothetical protein [Acidisoma cellulosilyticum]MCB8882308.1 hypothetical protein [Acidisoma cellulosilyticum]
MRSRNAAFGVLALLGLMASGPAFSQTTTASAPATAPTSPAAAPSGTGPATVDSDEAFMTGLRRIGVMAGEVVQCAPEADRKAEISDAMSLANLVALHFGLAAAFNFSGAVGYGSGKPFDKAGCAEASSGWNNIKQKYLNQ